MEIYKREALGTFTKHMATSKGSGGGGAPNPMDAGVDEDD